MFEVFISSLLSSLPPFQALPIPIALTNPLRVPCRYPYETICTYN